MPVEVDNVDLQRKLYYAFGKMNESAETVGNGRKKIEGTEARRAKLESLPRYGFASVEQEEWATKRIIAVGLPIDNYKRISRKENKRGREENVLASWGIGSRNRGEFSVYALLDREVPQSQIGTIAHEGWHANTPLLVENAYLYGSEEARKEAAEFATAAADQSIVTRKFLTGYHKQLYRQYIEGYEHADKQSKKEAYDIFVEETGSIAAELAISNRAKLEQVQNSQHAALDRLYGAGLIDKPEKVFLMSGEGKDGSIEVRGIDKPLIQLVDGVSDYAGLMNHVQGLKKQFYPDEDLTVAIDRGTAAPIDVTLEFNSLHVNQNARV